MTTTTEQQTKSFPVLLVEDNPGDARLVVELLSEATGDAFRVVHVEQLADARQEVMEAGTGCVLLDLSLPDAARLEALMQLRAAAPDVPIVILSGLQDELLAVKAVQEGAQDYLVKGRADGEAIGRSIRYAVERKALEMQTAHKALHDPLTSLPNRDLFHDRLKHAITRAKRHDSLIAVMFLDLDGFKPINDALGHEVGDRLLTALAKRLEDGLRGSDTPARFGGDEFVVLCEDVADEQHVIAIGERLQRAIAEPFQIDDHELHVTSSMGVVVSDGRLHGAGELIRNADEAMYRAKRQGVPYEVFDEGMRTRVRARARNEIDLQRAVDEREFRLLYQPQIDLRSGEIVGLEALIRWDHPERGVVEPSEFMWLAEETGLITRIGEWELRQSCLQARAWGVRSGRPLRVSVHLSGRQHRDRGLVDLVERVLTETRTDPAVLCLEITESVAVEDAETAIATLLRLKEVGVSLSIGEFGTGNSSLGSLKRFPLDMLKIDRSFVHGLESDPEDLAVVTAIVGLARSLGLETIADGVETKAQVDALKELGCEKGQGHYFARPRPSEAIAELLGSREQVPVPHASM
jgi:diguanylate cyclase (GGDEF)-like protein